VASNGDPPRALSRGRRRAKRAPGARTLRPSEGSITLEEVLVGFQRSLARATRSSLETSRADWQVGLGQRALYVVDGIGVTLQAGVVMALDAAGQVQAVSLDLGADGGPGQATLEFRVSSRPIEVINGEQLVLADLDPLGLRRPRYAMRATLIGTLAPGEPAVQALREVPVRNLEANVEPAPPRAPIWGPLPGRKLHLYVVGSDTGRTEAFSLTTNSIGQLDIEIDALANRITSGDLSATFAELDLTGRDDEFFAWAASSPGLAAGIENNLTSNVLQFTVKRDAAKG
jgi:hypothetical protein